MANVDLVMRLLAEDRASDKFKKVAGEVDTASGRLGKFNKVAGLVSAAAITAFGVASVKAYAEAEQQQIKLQSAYKRFPKIADVSIGSLRDLNSELQRTTKYDDDVVAGAQAILAQFNLTGSQIKSITPLVLDYASATGQDATSAAESLGKAFMGNARALKAIGIDFKATGDTAKDFATIQGLLSAKVGGFAEDEAKSAAGQLAILQNQFGDLQETVGGALVPALTGLVNIVKPLAEGFNRLPEPVKTAAVGAGLLGAALVTLVPKIAATKVAMTELGVTTGKTGKAMGVGAKAVGVFAAAMAASAVVNSFSQAQADAAENTDALGKALQNVASGGSLDLLGRAFTTSTGRAADFNEALGLVRDNHWWDQLEDGLAGVLGTTSNFGMAQDAVKALDGQLSKMVSDGAAAEALVILQRMGISADEAAQILPDYSTAVKNAGAASAQAATGVGKVTDAVDDAKDAVKQLENAWKIFNGTLSRQEAKDAAIKAAKQLDDALAKNGTSFKGTSDKALENRDALRQAMEAVQKHVDAMSSGPAKAKAYQDGLSTLRDTLKAQGLSKKEQDALLAPLIAAQDEIDNLKRKAAATVTLKIQPRIMGDGTVQIQAPGGGRQLLDVEYRAAGGPVTAGKAYIVGEQGPELFRPSTSGTIVPNGGFGGGAAQVNVYLDSRLVQTGLVDLKRQQGGRLNF